MVLQKIVSCQIAMRHFFLLILGFNFILTAVVPGDKRTLFDAVQSGNVKEVKKLINAGADVNLPNKHKSIPLHLAAGNGNKDIVKILMTFGSNVNAEDIFKRTPLHWASFNGHEQIILLLTSNEADVNRQTIYGDTPLMYAANRGHQRAVERLLLNGADASIKSDNGKTPKDVAIEKGHANIVEVLMQYSRAAWKACESYIERYATSDDRILGGRPADHFEFPWMAALGYSYRDKTVNFDCGAIIVSEDFVLTAAHCATNRQTPVLVRVGNVSLTEGGNSTDYEVKEIIRHSKYSFLSKKNDIALIRLKTKINFNNRTFPGCLRTDMHDVKPTVKLIVTGWGTTDSDQLVRAPILMKTQLKPVSLSECKAMLGEFNERANLSPLRNVIDKSQCCAYDPQARNDSCQGDSGGPLQHFPGGTNMAEIVGIVSYGIACGTELPSVYTRIAFYLDWIESIVWPNIETSTPYSFL